MSGFGDALGGSRGLPGPAGAAGSAGSPGVPAAISLGAFGTPVVFGSPTSYTVAIEDGRLVLELQASGSSPAQVMVPFPAALAANGIVARVCGSSWGNTAQSHGGVYAGSADGKYTCVATVWGAGWHYLKVAAAWASSTSAYYQTSQHGGCPTLALVLAGGLVSGRSGPTHPLWEETLATHLGDVAEYGVFTSVGTGYWTRLEFDLVRARI